MLDCENRISAARYFLERARDGALPDSLHVWYTQATIIFGVAALENLMYDYAERKTGRPVKRTERADLRYFKRMLGSQTDFYNRLEIGMNKSKLYWFLRNERNEIAHRGERNKSSAGEGGWTTTHYFEGWPQQSVDEACQEFCDWTAGIIEESKRSYPELR